MTFGGLLTKDNDINNQTKNDYCENSNYCPPDYNHSLFVSFFKYLGMNTIFVSFPFSARTSCIIEFFNFSRQYPTLITDKFSQLIPCGKYSIHNCLSLIIANFLNSAPQHARNAKIGTVNTSFKGILPFHCHIISL
jgi:hypothetical protein